MAETTPFFSKDPGTPSPLAWQSLFTLGFSRGVGYLRWYGVGLGTVSWHRALRALMSAAGVDGAPSSGVCAVGVPCAIMTLVGCCLSDTCPLMVGPWLCGSPVCSGLWAWCVYKYGVTPWVVFMFHLQTLASPFR